MKKFTQLLFLITFTGFIIFGCDSVTSPDADGQNSTANLNKGSGQGTDTDNDNGEDPDPIIVNVDELDENWTWERETGENGNVEFVNGPDAPIIGEGSAKFTLGDDEDGVVLSGAIFDGSIPLANLETLEYNTYQPEGFESPTVSLQFNINYENDDNDEWQGRLVFEPYYEGSINTGKWQTWDALTQRGWWATGAPGNVECTMQLPCTLQEILDEFPDAEIRSEEVTGLIHFKAGSGWGAFEGYVDGFTIAINEESITYNFQSSESDEEEEGNGDEDENGEDTENGDDEDNGDNGENDENGEDEENDNGTENGDNGEENGDDENGENGDETENGEDEEDNENPSVKEDCKNGGYADYNFRNQGQCIRYVNTGKDSRNGEHDDKGDEENGDEEENGDNGDENDNEDEETSDDPATIEDCKNGGYADYNFRNQGQCVRYINTGKDSRNGEHDDETENGDEEENGDNGEEENGENDNGNGDNGSNNDGQNNNNSGNNNEDDQNGGNGDDNGDSDVTGDDDEQNDPETADDCKQGGWQEFGFNNQGQCIQFVNTGRDNR